MVEPRHTTHIFVFVSRLRRRHRHTHTHTHLLRPWRRQRLEGVIAYLHRASPLFTPCRHRNNRRKSGGLYVHSDTFQRRWFDKLFLIGAFHTTRGCWVCVCVCECNHQAHNETQRAVNLLCARVASFGASAAATYSITLPPPPHHFPLALLGCSTTNIEGERYLRMHLADRGVWWYGNILQILYLFGELFGGWD